MWYITLWNIVKGNWIYSYVIYSLYLVPKKSFSEIYVFKLCNLQYSSKIWAGLNEGFTSLHDSLGLRPTFAWLVEVGKACFPLAGPSGQALPGPRGHRPCPLSQWDPGVRNTKVKHKLLLSGTFIEQFSSRENNLRWDKNSQLAHTFPILTIIKSKLLFGWNIQETNFDSLLKKTN